MHVQHLDNVSFISSNKLLSRVGSLHFPSMDTEFSPFKRKDEPLVEVWFWSYPHCCPHPQVTVSLFPMRWEYHRSRSSQVPFQSIMTHLFYQQADVMTLDGTAVHGCTGINTLHNCKGSRVSTTITVCFQSCCSVWPQGTEPSAGGPQRGEQSSF